MRRGYTLLELSAVLALMAAAVSILLSAGGGARDRWAVEAAREQVAGLIAEARTAAVAWGGAVVRLSASDAEAWYEAGGVEQRRVALARDVAVELVLSRGGVEVVLRYDALGLGQVASQTLRFRRGAAEAVLVVSGYGRVRRW
jgi:prepilin-type N-terminal cleavage/methylation domain-containing protein